MSFSSLGLSAELLRAIADKGYDAPTPIQARAIPVILDGRDLMATAQTGTGKTAAFTLPILQRLAQSAGKRGVRTLVLVPTRELAAQVGEAVRTYGRHLRLRCAEVYGGVNINPQIKQLRHGVDVLVATPGRLIDHMTRRTVDLSAVEVLVLDEGDRMLDMGFLPAIERIVQQLPRARQTLLFSATFSDPIRKLASRFQNAPQAIEVAPRNAAASDVSQSAYLVDAGRKRELLAHLIDTHSWQQVLVFTRTKHGADRLAKQLDRHGIGSVAIHGNKSQNARSRALADFKGMRVRALVATDVAARGIDINDLPHVVNFDLPHVPEDYVHRIGRTGRAGQAGQAVSLVAREERAQFNAIKRLVKLDIPANVVAGFEPGTTPRATTDKPTPYRGARPNAAAQNKRRGNGQSASSSQMADGGNGEAKVAHRGERRRHEGGSTPARSEHGNRSAPKHARRDRKQGTKRRAVRETAYLG
jgi:ATP-dependent RNA helicase RhlE